MRRRFHQLSLHAQSARRSRPGLQPRRIRRGLHQLPLDPGTRRHLGHLRPTPGARRSLALRRLHHRHHRRHVVVGRPLCPRCATPRPRRMDGPRPPLQQRHLRRLDIRRRTRDAPVHLFHRRSRRLPQPVRQQSRRTADRLFQPRRRRADATRRPLTGRLLLRLVRRPTPCHRGKS